MPHIDATFLRYLTTTTGKASAQREQTQIKLAFCHFAYDSCICPVDLKRLLSEKIYPLVIGPATPKGYQLSFNYHLHHRNCGTSGALDSVPSH